ncbi:MAG: T9SS type A sorting domain-containing protein [Bacteroidetes bacterium]|nr:T9SS type A sorting domain-containing protein [Bacteroidota bacterium]
MYTGSIHDVELQNFFTSLTLSNIGLIGEIDELLADNDYANAFFANQDLVSTNLMESNLETVNRICTSLELDYSLLDSLDREELLFIAYQYPRLGGEAVYRARAILGIDVDDTEIAFRIRSDLGRSIKDNFIVIPNPSTGEFKVAYSLMEDEIAWLELYDNLGKIISSKMVNNNSTFINFKESRNMSGVYNLKIKTSTGFVANKKVVILK